MPRQERLKLESEMKVEIDKRRLIINLDTLEEARLLWNFFSYARMPEQQSNILQNMRLRIANFLRTAL